MRGWDTERNSSAASQLERGGRFFAGWVAQGPEGIQELLAIVADNEDQRVPSGARASLMLLAAQLQALQTLIGLLASHSAALPYQAASVCYYDFEQPVYCRPT